MEFSSPSQPLAIEDDRELRIGDQVKVSPNCKFASEWRDTYLITGMRWNHLRGHGRELDISISSEADIRAGYGDTDGFGPGDLIFVSRGAVQ